ncbi:hypothetical protein GJ744_000610 [Endocarpon pusillum]|uniref:Uncharacterized protein n=1 Tax=Endocarpon pusillum TaxID=364733 RepID=A0A8H7E3U1_9EURO|nr:hypothetical protein GJ744_000610 [Endocarpon pusillum]
MDWVSLEGASTLLTCNTNMKSFLLAAVAVLITFATKVASAPTPASFDKACVGTNCVYPAGRADPSTHQTSVSKNVLINAGDRGFEAMPVKALDQDTAQAENSMWMYPCHEGCPLGFKQINLGGGNCACLGGRKRDADLAPQVMNDPGRFPVPMDPRVHCTNFLKGRCLNGQVGLWDSRNGRCFCGSAKTVVDLVTREEQSVSQDAVDRDGKCADIMGVQCANGTVGVWDNDKQRCCCGITSKNLSMPGPNDTTGDMLTSRLLPQPLKYPTGISPTDWTAIEVTLVLLDETLKSQTDLGQVCTGEKDLQAFGFKPEIFAKICKPEITMPVAQPEIAKAQKKVYSALWIDTILGRHHNGGLYDFYGACEEARVPDAVPSTLDKEYILSQLCNKGH